MDIPKEVTLMKEGIHPKYEQTTVRCACGEVIIIEGVADCAFVESGELVIVDFKTDRANSADELADRYRDQLSVYRRCLSEVLGLPVKETLIYSFRLGKSINI